MVNSVFVGLSFVLSDATVRRQPKLVHGTHFSDSVGRGVVKPVLVSLVTVTFYVIYWLLEQGFWKEPSPKPTL